MADEYGLEHPCAGSCPPNKDFDEMLEDNRNMDGCEFMLGELMDCPRCGQKMKCVRVIPANMQHADPTEAYELECGHVVI